MHRSKAGNTIRIDASLVLNLHHEASFLKRTLLSIDQAVDAATLAGLRMELVAVLDRADQNTRVVLSGHDFRRFTNVKVLEVDNGSLGPSRNEGIQAADGEFIITADGDDLICENFFVDMVRCTRANGSDTLCFPEYVLNFGSEYHITVYKELSVVTPMALLEGNAYISRLCAHRSVFSKIQYADIPVSRGYAYEDWHFNAEAVGVGLNLKVAPRTLLFYRRRPGSLLDQAEKDSTRQIPPCRLFEPSVYLEICKPYLTDNPSNLYRDRVMGLPPDLLRDPHMRKCLAKVNAIEPLVSLARFESAGRSTNVPGSLAAGSAYHTICKALGDATFDEVFMFPHLAMGGAERYTLALMEALYESAPFGNTLVLIGEDPVGPNWLHKCPPNATIVNLPRLCGSLTLQQRCLLALKTIEASCPGARIHIRQSYFGDGFLDRYGSVLHGQEVIYYRFSDDERMDDEGRTIVFGSPLALIGDHIEHLTRIVTDNETIIAKDQHRLGLNGEKWSLLHAPVTIPSPRARSPHHDTPLLWASRLHTSKRPSLIRSIAQELASRRSRSMIEVYGASEPNSAAPETFKGLANVRYFGPFDEFQSLPLERHSIFLYTSWCDGIPNVLLEAMAAGLAVIAPDVGGISELVTDNVTGILLRSTGSERDMARAYAEAIRRLQGDPAMTARLIKNARELVIERHSPGAFRKRAAELFKLPAESALHG